ncbi:CopG family antitoxin [Candidatus Margulisiibacteriota bacterium]
MKMPKKSINKEITSYDDYDTTNFINKNKPKKLTALGLKLPSETPTSVISIRLPKRMLNIIRAFSSENDMPYQTVIKMFLQEEIKRHKLAS